MEPTKKAINVEATSHGVEIRPPRGAASSVENKQGKNR
jgi:hypothetical protein